MQAVQFSTPIAYNYLIKLISILTLKSGNSEKPEIEMNTSDGSPTGLEKKKLSNQINIFLFHTNQHGHL